MLKGLNEFDCLQDEVEKEFNKKKSSRPLLRAAFNMIKSEKCIN